MKIIHGSLSGLLARGEGTRPGRRRSRRGPDAEHGRGRGDAALHELGDCLGPRGREKWAEWRLVVGRQRAEITEHGPRPGEARRPHGGDARRGAGLDRDGGARDARRHPRRRRGDARGGPGLACAPRPARPAGADNYLALAPHHRRAPRARAPPLRRVRDVQLALRTGRSRHQRCANELACPGPADRAELEPRRDALPPPSAQGPHRLSKSTDSKALRPRRPRRGPRRAGRRRGSGAPARRPRMTAAPSPGRPAGRRKPFIALRKGLTEHVLSGRLTGSAFGVYVWLHLQADHRTGTLRTNAGRLAGELGHARREGPARPRGPSRVRIHPLRQRARQPGALRDRHREVLPPLRAARRRRRAGSGTRRGTRSRTRSGTGAPCKCAWCQRKSGP